ncbi:MAG: XdhC family protein [Gammaproteobacteria bacterium]|nr:XdhC family protein [Gammaproteobacteria bacterium]MBU1926599.1 XdhC family protein [Gammaproteobacteria bacterium]MBU2546584.1 XdhC family protein [Gammaproteobacteria bacterium]
MRDNRVWVLLQEAITRQVPAALMVVIDSQSSSPGRQGFKMAIDLEGNLAGSIGGGLMEHDLVEKTKEQLHARFNHPILLNQLHNDSGEAKDRSGMICSGSQKVVIYPISLASESVFQFLQQPLKEIPTVLQLSQTGLSLIPKKNHCFEGRYFCDSVADTSWCYREDLSFQKVLYIIGGGHVSLALSRIMETLDFYVVVFDDRPKVSTLENNLFAQEKHIISYEQVGSHIQEGERCYAVIMTASHKADHIVLEQLVNKRLRYLGMMASKAKGKAIFNQLLSKGIDQGRLSKVHTPVGLPIASKTPEEIAISISAEIVSCEHDQL